MRQIWVQPEFAFSWIFLKVSLWFIRQLLQFTGYFLFSRLYSNLGSWWLIHCQFALFCYCFSFSCFYNFSNFNLIHSILSLISFQLGLAYSLTLNLIFVMFILIIQPPTPPPPSSRKLLWSFALLSCCLFWMVSMPAAAFLCISLT